jgi:hypothetical protein
MALLLGIPSAAPAQIQPDSTPPARLRLPDFSSRELREAGSVPQTGSLHADAAQFGYTSRFLFRRIFHPSNRAAAWLSVGAILGASAALEHNKNGVQSNLLDYSNEETNEISATSKILGNAGVVPGIGLLLFLQGKIFKQPRVHETGLMVLESAVYTAIFTEAGRFVLAEQRPDEGGDLKYFQSSGHGISGHASIAASIAAPLSRGLFRVDADDGRWARFGKRFGSGVAYGLPVLTGLSRIEDNRHYAWNVALGLALGFSVGETVADAHDAFSEEGGDHRWKPDSVGPLLSDQGRGVALNWRF